MAVPTTAEIEALEGAIRRGARRVKYEDREVEYFSLPAMRAELLRMKQEAGLVSAAPHRTVAVFNNGLQGPPPGGEF